MKFLPDGKLKSGTVSNKRFIYPLTGAIEDSVGYKSGKKELGWTFHLKLSNAEYEQRKAALTGEARETRVAGKKLEPSHSLAVWDGKWVGSDNGFEITLLDRWAKI